MEFCDSNVELPPNWIKKVSKSHPDKFYYYNIITKKSVWKLSDLPKQTPNKEKSKIKTPNKQQYTSISHGSKSIKRNIAEDRLKSLKTVLSKEVNNEIKNDQKILTQNNATTSESPRSAKKHYSQSSIRPSFTPMKVTKMISAQQRLQNLTSSFKFESEELPSVSPKQRQSESSVKIDTFTPKRLTTNSVNHDMFTPNRSLTSNNFNGNFTPNRTLDSDNSARKILKARKSVQDRVDDNSDVFMLDVSGDITNEEMDDKMDWEEIPSEKVVEKVQNVRNNPDMSSISSNNKVRTSHRNVQHSEDHFYCVIDTNVFLSNLDVIKTMVGRIYKNIGKAVVYVPYMVLNELDKIKTYGDNLARHAQRAIKVINDNMKIKNPLFCAQSATDQMRIIQIQCGDDLILNACLQINNITPKVLLLSNDINLRNKAHANHICCMSRDEFVYTNDNSSNKIKFE